MNFPRRLYLPLKTLLFSLLILSSPSFAQQPLGYNVTRVEIRPGTNLQFERFITRFKQGAERINWPTPWTAEQVAVGNTLTYMFIAPFNSFSQLSTPATAVLGQAYTPAEAEEILNDLTASAVSLTTGTYHPRADLSHPRMSPVPNQEVVTAIQVSVKPVAQLDFENWVHKVVEGSGGVYWNGLVKSYGEGPDYVFRSPGTWAQLDQPVVSPQQRVLTEFGGAEGARIIEQAMAATESAGYSLSVSRPDLSYTP